LLSLQRAAKKKKIHAFKSKARLEQMELTQNKRQNAWQQFQTTEGKTKKVSAHSFCITFEPFSVSLNLNVSESVSEDCCGEA
jgi:hypothetical protein